MQTRYVSESPPIFFRFHRVKIIERPSSMELLIKLNSPINDLVEMIT